MGSTGEAAASSVGTAVHTSIDKLMHDVVGDRSNGILLGYYYCCVPKYNISGMDLNEGQHHLGLQQYSLLLL